MLVWHYNTLSTQGEVQVSLKHLKCLGVYVIFYRKLQWRLSAYYFRGIQATEVSSAMASTLCLGSAGGFGEGASSHPVIIK